MPDPTETPPSVELRRIADELAQVGMLHQPGAALRFPVAAIARLRAVARDVDAMERRMAAIVREGR